VPNQDRTNDTRLLTPLLLMADFVAEVGVEVGTNHPQVF